MAYSRGKLIVFEGLDRSGKSTQHARLIASLRSAGHQVLSLRFPDRTTPIGIMINEYLTGTAQTENHVIHLLFSANRWEHASNIEDALERGMMVVVDRYYYSGAVYSAAKNDPKMGLEWCRQQEVGLPRPDLCLFLNVDGEVVEKRGGFGLERYEKKEMQDRVRELFEEMRRHEDEKEDMVVIDAGKTIEEVGREIWRRVEERLRKVDEERQPLRYVAPW